MCEVAIATSPVIKLRRHVDVNRRVALARAKCRQALIISREVDGANDGIVSVTGLSLDVGVVGRLA
jgi:hypothetical protein